MTPEQESHLSDIIKDFTEKVDAKYRAGQQEHGGNLWLKKGIIDMAINEAIDQVVYLLSIKKQLDDKGIVLGEIDE